MPNGVSYALAAVVSMSSTAVSCASCGVLT
jgi:ribosomal protein S27E